VVKDCSKQSPVMFMILSGCSRGDTEEDGEKPWLRLAGNLARNRTGHLGTSETIRLLLLMMLSPSHQMYWRVILGLISAQAQAQALEAYRVVRFYRSHIV
jgi:hypothetical protein